jgi:hypothetical protein
MQQSPEISLRRRIWLWIGAWSIAAIATVWGSSPSLLILVYAWLFPIGLFGFEPANWQAPVSTPVFLVLSWMFYVVLTIIGLSQSRRVRYFVVFGNWNYAIEFTFAETTNDFTIEKSADGKSSFYKDNRKLIQAILYKNGLEVCRSAK